MRRLYRAFPELIPGSIAFVTAFPVIVMFKDSIVPERIREISWLSWPSLFLLAVSAGLLAAGIWLKRQEARGTAPYTTGPEDKAIGPQPHTLPPRTFFLLALVVPRETRDAALGDALERFKSDADRFGAKRARFLFYKDLLVDIGLCAVRVVTSPVTTVVRVAIREISGK